MKEKTPLQPGEEIRSIIDYEGLYSITSFGRIWSHLKFKGYRWYGGHFLKLGLNLKGYLYINLHKDGKKKNYWIHRLVATHFIPNPLNLPEVNHKDGIKANCRKDNLEWCTSQDNQNHALINKLKFKKHSEFYGVSCNKRGDLRCWISQIIVNKKHIYLGSYYTEIEAAQAYNDYIIKNDIVRPLNKI